MKLFKFLLLLSACFALSGCYYSHPNKVDHWVPTGRAVDSVQFLVSHYYWRGYNFATTDSLCLLAETPRTDAENLLSADGLPLPPATVRRNTRLVVADVRYVPADTVDSVWVKVASDQFTQGWVRESELLESVTPDDPISWFIHTFSSFRTLILCSLVGVLTALIVGLTLWRHKRTRPRFGAFSLRRGLLAPGGWQGAFTTFYPTLLCLCISGSAALYGSIQKFVPDTWVEFYFHPTLNPLNPDLPPVMALFVSSVWLLVIVSLATALALLRQETLRETVVHLAGLACVCVLLYLLLTLTIPLYIGYALFPAYWAYAVWRYRSLHRTPLFCGRCGALLESEGICPHCGAKNI